MKAIIKLIRPQQWTKNVFVLLPVFFGGALLNGEKVSATVVTLVAFCFAASSVYCLNDIIDVEDDRRHPAKCGRPIASGAVSVRRAYGLMGGLVLLSVATIWMGAWLLPSLREGEGWNNPAWSVTAVILSYWLMNICYCKWLKRLAVIDVCIVAMGFVMRIFAGGFAANVALSRWIVMMTFLLTLFLSFAKRRDDVLRMEATGEAPRANTSRYNLTFINQAITITASVTLVCYIMYTVSPEVVARFHTDDLYLTTAFVLLGLLRYIQIAVVDQKSGDPTKVVLHDTFTQLILVAWLASFLFIIYLS